MKLLSRKVLQVHSPQRELLHSQCKLAQRLEPQFPTSQGKCPSDNHQDSVFPSVARVPLDHKKQNASSRTWRLQRLTLQLRGQGIQLGCGKSMFNSLLTWF